MNFGSSCISFCRENNIGEWIFDFNSNKSYFEFTVYEFKKLCNLELVFNGVNGGLVLGNLHSEGGIHLIVPISENKLRYAGEMEGWEYLTSPINNGNQLNKLTQINDSIKNPNNFTKSEFEIPHSCKIIDTMDVIIPFILITAGVHVIINRTATKKYIKEIIELDK